MNKNIKYDIVSDMETRSKTKSNTILFFMRELQAINTLSQLKAHKDSVEGDLHNNDLDTPPREESPKDAPQREIGHYGFD